jgi:hypothetical protein
MGRQSAAPRGLFARLPVWLSARNSAVVISSCRERTRWPPSPGHPFDPELLSAARRMMASCTTQGYTVGLHRPNPGVQESLILQGFLEVRKVWRRGRDSNPRKRSTSRALPLRPWRGRVITHNNPSYRTDNSRSPAPKAVRRDLPDACISDTKIKIQTRH